jgi:hypothetical protein
MKISGRIEKLSERKTEAEEILTLQAKLLSALLNGMNCYLWVAEDGQIMLNSKSNFTKQVGVPVIQEDL